MANKVDLPEGRHTVTPFLVLRDAGKFLDFAVKAFEATLIERFDTPNGDVMHAEIRIGDSVIMIGGAQDKVTNGMLHLYTPDTDASYRRAIEAGAKSIREPADQFYGHRSAGVEDAWGNTWWFAQHIEDVSPEELKRRMAARK
jgi:uncharacterized glyoxalase superfamily protein PhnB